MNYKPVHLDSKGRLQIPFYLRRMLNIDDSTELIMTSDNGHISLTPMEKKIPQIKMTMRDDRNLKSVMRILSKHGAGVLASYHKYNGSGLEWSAFINCDKDRGRTLAREITKINGISDFDLTF
ncbi:MAG: hypothetical protein J4473_00960 [Candidatus Aenigmarchaeota archaeon]|nr:hypothetical protein [Candidatus Aenigmarchaeota archaeon]